MTSALVLGAVGYLQYTLPDSFTVTRGAAFHIGSFIEEHTVDGRSVSAPLSSSKDNYRTDLRLAGYIPIKTVDVTVVDRPVVMVCGSPFGIKLYTDGVLIVGMSDVATAAGLTNPAAAAGVCVGDTILSINGQSVSTNRQVSRLIGACQGKAVTLTLRRDGVTFEATFTPAYTPDEGYRAGLWVRDSTAGVGILTFYNPQSGVYGGLGHPVCDTDTGEQLSISGGEIVPARIYDVVPSRTGSPGELQGGFDLGTLGALQRNGVDGLYGKLTVYPMSARSMPVAMRQEIKTGSAQILTTVEGTTPALYDVTVEQVRYNASSTRHMVIRVTDPDLLEKTGGIVQGMSVCYN